MSRSLITVKGCAGRYGSVITTLDLVLTRRNYYNPFEHCNFCGECMNRCSARAIRTLKNERTEGMDKSICKTHLDIKIRPRFKACYGCGKCQIAVQCEHDIPSKKNNN